MIKKHILVCIALGLTPLSGAAHWLWLDEAGRRVYSDQPPAPSVPAARVLRQPGRPAPSAWSASSPTPSPVTAPAPPQAAAPRSAPSASTPTADDEAVRALKEQNARLRDAHCARLRATWASLASGQRLARILPNGEREVLDDAGRAAERQRLQEALASDCPRAE